MLAMYIIASFIIIGLMFLLFRVVYNKGWRNRGIKDNGVIEYYRGIADNEKELRRKIAAWAYKTQKRLATEIEALNILCAEKDSILDSLNESIRQKNLAIENLKIWNFPPPKNQLLITAEDLIEDSHCVENKEIMGAM